MGKRALITGLSGQDGSYLAELLLSKNYEVHGLIRRGSGETNNHQHLKGAIFHYGDICTDNHLCYLINDLKPDEIYNLAAQSDVGISFECPEYTGDSSGLGVLRILEAIKHFSPNSKFYQASTSELFGNSPPPQDESTPLKPESPYGVAKLYGCAITRVYRRSYGIFACNGILFNHESPRRGLNFVTRKITHAVARINYRLDDGLKLGNLDARRDWGYAPDYCEAMWLMLQQKEPEDFVIGTGQAHSVRDFVRDAFALTGRNYQDYVSIDAQYFRPLEVNSLCANPAKAYKVLNWKPKTTFNEMVEIMVDADMKLVASQSRLEVR